MRAALLVAELSAQLAQLLAIATEKKPTKFLEFLHRVGSGEAHAQRLSSRHAELVLQTQCDFAEHFGERFTAGHRGADLFRFTREPGLHVIVFFANLRAE